MEQYDPGWLIHYTRQVYELAVKASTEELLRDKSLDEQAKAYAAIIHKTINTPRYTKVMMINLGAIPQ